MNGHIEAWIDAYLDNELGGSQRQQIETHIIRCQNCKEMLEQRRALSGLLQQVPPAAHLKPEKQFTAEVGLRLARRQLPDRLQSRIVRLGWHLIPVGLLLTLAFIQAVVILRYMLALFPSASETLMALSALPALPIEIPGALSDLLSLLGVFNLLDWNWLTGFAALGITGFLYLGWLAVWWVRNQHNHVEWFLTERS
jgi:anti-sigma factor RsiW